MPLTFRSNVRSGTLGLDIGGTSSRARLSDGGRVVAEAEGPGANVAALPPRLVDQRLTALLAQLGPMHPAACCAGSAGAEIPAGRARLEAFLRRRLPGCPISVVHDTRLVLAAAGLEEGIALIAGTGSVAYGRAADGREAQVGGWGWMLGDDGSGAWITREAAREVTSRADQGDPLGPLGDALLVACGVSDVRQMTGKLHSMREPMEWAALAPAVFEAADADTGAHSIVMRAAAGLCRLTHLASNSVGIDGPVVLAGGLLLNARMLSTAVQACLGRQCVRLEQPPVAGASRLAEALLR